MRTGRDANGFTKAHRTAQPGKGSFSDGSGFTPGPWTVLGTDTLFTIYGDDGVQVLKTSWHSHLRKPYPLKAEAFANATLAAAAPDLLMALKDALRSSRKDFKLGPDGDRQHREAYAEQFAAIDKARTTQAPRHG